MTFTIKAGIDNDVKIQFINQSINEYNIQRISLENEVSEDAINIESKNRKNALDIMTNIVTPDNFEIDLGGDADSIIVLWA